MSQNLKIKIRYSTPEAFIAQYRAYIVDARLFLAASQALPHGTQAELIITIPGFEGPFVITGTVDSVVDRGSKTDTGQKGGILFRLIDGQHERLKRLEGALARHDLYRGLIRPTPTGGTRGPARDTGRPHHPQGQDARSPREAPPVGSPSSLAEERFDWLRRIIRDRDTVARIQTFGPEKTPTAPAPTGDRVRREFTIQERERIEPVAAFILNLAKAMLRSGYYAPEHPGSKKAKEGIYADFRRAVADRTDITMASQETRGRFDVMISGILDDQISLRGLIGPEQAEIYMPKLKDYFARKNLVSFSLKRGLPLGHFEDFIDVMSDPMRDKGIEGQVGNLLTTALVERGITEVSTIFIDDMIIFELKLPWRVEMAIQRLAKDLKVLPMFKDKNAQEIQEIKIRIIQDIIRPLREPHMLKDIVVNAHVIARNVAAVDAEDLEQTIVKTFPMEILIPTSKYVFEELGRIKGELKGKPDHKGLINRFESVKRILRWISARVIGEKIAGGESFFEQLYLQKILSYDELPEPVKDHVNTMMLVKEFAQHHPFYVERFRKVSQEGDVLLFLRFFRRILPPLLEQRHYDLISLINSSVLTGFGLHPTLKTSTLEHLRNPIKFIWKDSMDILAKLFEDETKEARVTIERIIRLLGPYGVSLLVHVLMESRNKYVRKSAVEVLGNMGDYGRIAMVKILGNPSHPWYIHRNALTAIARLGKPDDAELVDRFLRHENPRIREEALGAVSTLEGASAEPRLFRALSDPDLGVRRRVVSCMGQLELKSPRSVTALAEILSIDEEKYPEHRQEITELKVEAINALSLIGNEPVFGDRTVQDVLIGLIMPDKKWSQKLVEKIRHAAIKREEDYVIQTAALKALWRMGTPEALESLSEFAEKADTVMVNRVKETIRQIQMRGRGPTKAT